MLDLHGRVIGGMTSVWGRFILKDYSHWIGPTLEEGKSVSRKEQQTTVKDWLQFFIPHMPVPIGGERDWE